MFRIVSESIQPFGLAGSSVGAVVVFEGRVRDVNEGKRVLSLEYEAKETLANKEGGRVVSEALSRFEIEAARCEHRVGHLQIGDVAIRVEVAAGHRLAAFQACQYIVDEVKARVPIWKKEHYADESARWIGA